ncbi:hypothetical protein N7462_010631 [Penicillium macrosclerotiorum]|uniref:uncharacterized protein n=1 Tax=Penicillium macrosclerotiorum TaxID=303699 RepID=UPI0025483C29|nr:uncharacterized protein N7462_010631 [Penicillium macrosclerotiorum]KAJ5669561.1 hypothetical protein N7462_010631 [Penicillium macrosclerotiorum]
MPNSTSSPVKRPGLARRAVSSHAVVTRTTANPNELSQSHSSKGPLHHKAHRAHVVGGGHRHHHRNPSFGKNLNKLQRFQLGPETTGRHHQRKKSAPATPIGSPKGTAHVRWDGALDDHPKNTSMKRNNSTPALRRNTSGIGKKSLVTERPHSSSEKKKTVGFELGDDENDDAEWEDTTQSPESTRRNSVAPSNQSLENTQVLVDPLTFVKRPYPQMPRATSLPDSITNKFVREDPEQSEEDQEEEEEESDETQDANQQSDQGDIANRLLSPSHSAKAPPAMSSISAMAKPSETASRSASFTLAAGQEGARRTFSTSNLVMAQLPGSHTQATSSSMEGGVSRFIMSNKSGVQASSRTDSDPNTPSSFLPHYHPQTPPSPGRGASKSTASPARPRGTDLPSRTQQKLWLQRTAALNNSPPESHGISTTASPSSIDPTFIAGGHSRTGSSAFDVSRGINGVGRPGASGHENEARHIRKAYEKTALELMVVRRFQSPTADSFTRLRSVPRASQALTVNAEQRSALGKPVKSAPSLTLLQHGRRPNRLASSSESKSQLPDPHSASEDPATHSESTDTAQASKSSHPSHRILSTSDEAAHGLASDQDSDDFSAVNETDMMVRRMWESREVATSG